MCLKRKAGGLPSFSWRAATQRNRVTSPAAPAWPAIQVYQLRSLQVCRKSNRCAKAAIGGCWITDPREECGLRKEECETSCIHFGSLRRTTLKASPMNPDTAVLRAHRARPIPFQCLLCGWSSLVFRGQQWHVFGIPLLFPCQAA